MCHITHSTCLTFFFDCTAIPVITFESRTPNKNEMENKLIDTTRHLNTKPLGLVCRKETWKVYVTFAHYFTL